MKKVTYDVFISHADKDKTKYVEVLVDEITKRSLSVFYDKESISWGEHIPSKIEYGLKNCRIAIIVISKNFIGRSYPEYELRNLLARQNREQKNIVRPILHNVSIKELREHYPFLADIKCIRSKQYSRSKIADLIAEELHR